MPSEALAAIGASAHPQRLDDRITHWLVRNVRRVRFWVGVAVATALVVLSATWLPYELAKVSVPDWSDMSYSDVVDAAGELDLDVRVDGRSAVPAEHADEFFVAQQSPAPGDRVERHTTITLDVVVEVPDVVDVHASSAVQDLRALRLDADLDVAGRPDYVLAHYVVVTQSPAAGSRVDPGTRIRLASEPLEVTVPSALEMTYGEAKAALNARGLEAAIADAPSVPAGLAASSADIDRILREEAPSLRVVEQSVGGDLRVDAGTEVVLVLELPFVAVPDLRGLSTSAASAALEKAGLAAASESLGGNPSWTIATQDPSAGALALPGSSVSFALAQPTIVYEVTGNGSRAMVTWIAPGTFNISQDTNARLPWSMSWPYNGSSVRGNFNAQMMNGNSITCRIIIDGQVVQENTSSGAYAVVSCG